MSIVTSADSDQYKGIYCNICGRIAQPRCVPFDRVHGLLRSEASRCCCVDTGLAVSTSDEIECDLQLVLLPGSMHPAPACTSERAGGVKVSLVCIILTAVHIEGVRLVWTAARMPMITPRGLPPVSLSHSTDVSHGDGLPVSSTRSPYQ